MKQRIAAAANQEPDPSDGELRPPYGYHLKFCTSSYKDAGQLRARFRRRGEATLHPYEVMSEDDTLMFGAMYCPHEHGEDDMAELVEVLNIDSSWLHWDANSARIEMPIIIAEELAEKLATPFAVVEVHPTHERLEVSLTWLNQHRP